MQTKKQIENKITELIKEFVDKTYSKKGERFNYISLKSLKEQINILRWVLGIKTPINVTRLNKGEKR